MLAVRTALPLDAAGKYVAGAYIVFVVVLLIYLAIMTLRANRTSRELAELRRELAERRTREGIVGGRPGQPDDPAAARESEPGRRTGGEARARPALEQAADGEPVSGPRPGPAAEPEREPAL